MTVQRALDGDQVAHEQGVVQVGLLEAAIGILLGAPFAGPIQIIQVLQRRHPARVLTMHGEVAAAGLDDEPPLRKALVRRQDLFHPAGTG